MVNTIVDDHESKRSRGKMITRQNDHAAKRHRCTGSVAMATKCMDTFWLKFRRRCNCGFAGGAGGCCGLRRNGASGHLTLRIMRSRGVLGDFCSGVVDIKYKFYMLYLNVNWLDTLILFNFLLLRILIIINYII